MEKRAASKVGHLPCITQRSNFQSDILNGTDSVLAFGDVLGQPQNFEDVTMRPHDLIEKTLAATKQ